MRPERCGHGLARSDPVRAAILLPEVPVAYTRNGDHTVNIAKAVVVATLRSRDLHDRADWVDREMPALIDTSKNASLLRTLGIDPETMSAETAAGNQTVAGDPR
jgi:hypothetical protein